MGTVGKNPISKAFLTANDDGFAKVICCSCKVFKLQK